MIILKNADVYAPEHLGKRDILIAGNKIEKIAEHLDGYENIAEAEIIDLQGKKTVPGYIDMHEHITGGGGEKGFASRVPEAQAGILLGNGITTVLGMLGTDGVTRSLENLVAKAYAFREEGIRAYTLTGFYGYPTPTLMENVERDVMMIDTMIGVKTSMSDHRSSNLTAPQLIDLATQARRGGMLSGKAGIVTIHVGPGPDMLKPLFEAVRTSDVPIQKFIPTHCGRTDALFGQAMEFAAMGGFIDITAKNEDLEGVSAKILRYFEQDPENHHLTMTSDGFGSMQKYNERMEVIGYTYASPSCLQNTVRYLVREKNVPLELALTLVTVNPADVLNLKGQRGCLKENAFADINVYDDEMNLQYVFTEGRKAVWDHELKMKGMFEE